MYPVCYIRKHLPVYSIANADYRRLYTQTIAQYKYHPFFFFFFFLQPVLITLHFGHKCIKIINRY